MPGLNLILINMSAMIRGWILMPASRPLPGLSCQYTAISPEPSRYRGSTAAFDGMPAS